MKILTVELVHPLVVVEIKEKTAKNPLALLTLEDLKEWGNKNGRMPERAMVAMNSGWAQHVEITKVKSLDQNGKASQPAFHINAVEFLIAERNIIALGVDTFSFANQLPPRSDAHYRGLSDNRMGTEKPQ